MCCRALPRAEILRSCGAQLVRRRVHRTRRQNWQTAWKKFMTIKKTQKKWS